VSSQCFHLGLLDWHAHVAAESAFPAIAFIFAHAALNTNASILAPLAWALAVAALLALAATLASRLT
jgi:hypothetical protein